MKTPKTILFFTNFFYPVVSGSSTQSLALACELTKRNFRVVVITPRLDELQKEYELFEGIHIYRIHSFSLPRMAITLNFPWMRWTFLPWNIKKIIDIYRLYKPSIIHLHNHMLDLALSAVLLKRKFGVPLIITIHTIVQHPNIYYNAILSLFDRVFLKNVVVESSDVVICPEMTIYRYVKERFGFNKTQIIPYGINEIINYDPELIVKIKKQYNLEGKKVILSLGHVHEIRDRKDLINSMPYVLKDVPDAVLLIVGAIGTEKPRQLAHELKVENSVIFTGAIPHSHVPSYFKIAILNAQWFVESNPQNKTLGIAALEAMSAGKVVIGTADENVYGDNILINGENIILVNLGEPESLGRIIVNLLNNEELCNSIGKKASMTIETNFSWEIVSSRTINLYECLLSHRNIQ